MALSIASGIGEKDSGWIAVSILVALSVPGMICLIRWIKPQPDHRWYRRWRLRVVCIYIVLAVVSGELKSIGRDGFLHALTTFTMSDTEQPNLSDVLFAGWVGMKKIDDAPIDPERIRLVSGPAYFSRGRLAMSPKGTQFLTGNGDSISLWDVETAKMIWDYHGPTGETYGFFPDGGQFFVRNRYRIDIFETSSHRLVRTLKVSVDSRDEVAVRPDGVLIQAGYGGLKELDSGKTWRDYPRLQFQALTSDCRFAVYQETNTKTTVIDIYDTAANKLIQKIETSQKHGGFWPTFEDHEYLLSPDGRFVAAIDKAILVWEVSSGRQVATIQPIGSRHLAFSSDGRYLARANRDSVDLWEMPGGRPVRTISIPGDHDGIQFLPGSSRAIVTGFSGPQLWDLASGEKLADSGTASGIGFRNYVTRGNTLFAGNVDGVERWDLESGAKAESWMWGLHHEEPRAVSADESGSTVLTYGRDDETDLEAWSPIQKRRLWSHHFRAPIRLTVRFAPGGSSVLVGSLGGAAMIDCASGRYLWQVNMPVYFSGSSAVLDADMTADGSRVVLSVSDGSLWIIDAATGKKAKQIGRTDWRSRLGQILWIPFLNAREREFDGPGAAPSVVLSDDGRYAYVFDSRRQAHRWNLQTFREEANWPTEWMVLLAERSPTNGNIVATVHMDGVRLWDVARGALLKRIPMRSVGGIHFLSGGRYLAIDTSERTVQIWDTEARESGAHVATLHSFSDGSWAVTDPEGRYDTPDPNNASGLHWVVGGEVIELKQLKERFYTPGLLGRILRGESLPETGGGIQRLALYPRVTAEPLHAGDRTLRVHLENQGGGIGRLLVRVNGKQLQAVPQPSAAARGDDGMDVSIPLNGAALSPNGKNLVEISASDRREQVFSRGLQLNWDTPTSDQPAARLFAVVVGVSDYAGEKLRLTYPAKDAEDIATALRLAGERFLGKEQVHVDVYSTSHRPDVRAPTKRNLAEAFEHLRTKAAPGDTLVVFLAGHGVTRADKRDSYYFLTADALDGSWQSPAAEEAWTISSDTLKSWCLRIPALHQVIILDTCAAGAAGRALTAALANRAASAMDQVRAMELLKDSTGSHILMGSASNASSYESTRYQHGLLTYALLEGMKGPALENGQRVDVSRLFHFAQHEVTQLASAIGQVQHPVVSSPQGSSFPIGLLPTLEDKSSIPLAAPKPALMRPICLNPDDDDPLDLTGKLRRHLRDLILGPGGRGASAHISYFDDLVDGVPDAAIPRVRYIVEKGAIKVRVTIFLGRKSHVSWLEGRVGNEEQLAEQIALRLRAAL